MLFNCLAVGCGGFIGSVLRYLCHLIKVAPGGLPLVTCGINVVGSFAIMFFTGILAKGAPVDNTLLLFLRVGLCGGFTTFSTFSAETLGMLESGNVIQAIAYAVLSVVLCLLAAWAGEAASAAVAH